jgi:hypothetical protein
MKSYFNTNREEGEVLKKSKEKALNQQEKLLKIFQMFPDRHFTPYQMIETYFEVFGERILTSSVHRAKSNLTDAGYLKKTADMRVERHGKNNHTWILNVEKDEPEPDSNINTIKVGDGVGIRSV